MCVVPCANGISAQIVFFIKYSSRAKWNGCIRRCWGRCQCPWCLPFAILQLIDTVTDGNRETKKNSIPFISNRKWMWSMCVRDAAFDCNRGKCGEIGNEHFSVRSEHLHISYAGFIFRFRERERGHSLTNTHALQIYIRNIDNIRTKKNVEMYN